MAFFKIALILKLSSLLFFFGMAEINEAPYMGEFELEVFKVVEAEVSAYTSSPEETDGDPFITASMERVYDGGIACPGRDWFGREVEILDRTYTCNDVMNKRYRGQMYFDIWMTNKGDAWEFGRKTLLIAIKQ